MEQAITIRGLQKTFRIGLRRKHSEALRGLDLNVDQGQVFGFLGPNGAGKTTTIKILVGLIRADGGTASIFSQTVRRAAVRQRVAYLPELPDFYDYLKPAEFLIHCGGLAGLGGRDLKRRVPDLLARVGLQPDEKRPLRKFSKGMLQRVGIAQTMLTDPDLYILDEPMGGLDPLGRRWVKEWIRDLGQRGKTVFFSSHVLAEAEAVCTRAAFIYKGKLVREGGLDELLGIQDSPWEILVEGQSAVSDPDLADTCSTRTAAGPDSLLILSAGKRPEDVLPLLNRKGHALRSVQRRHATLEDAFVQMVDQGKGA